MNPEGSRRKLRREKISPPKVTEAAEFRRKRVENFGRKSKIRPVSGPKMRIFVTGRPFNVIPLGIFPNPST